MKNEKNPTVLDNAGALSLLITPIDKRNDFISPVTFIRKNEKTGVVEDAIIALECHPSCYADATIHSCTGLISEDGILEDMNGDELIACAYTIEHTFASRANIELFNAAAYVYGSICAMYGITMTSYKIPECNRLRMHKNVPDKSLSPEEINTCKEIYGIDSEICDLDLTHIVNYGSTITNYTIPYISNALLANIMNSMTFDSDFMRKNSMGLMNQLNELMPHYHSVLMGTLLNLNNLAEYYRDNNPINLKVEAGYEIHF